MSDYKLSLTKLTKAFGRRLIFKDLTHTFTSGNVYGIAGSNGSGKSTLVKIIAGVLSATHGKLEHTNGGIVVDKETLHTHLGFAAPYLVLYDEFTAEENLRFFSKIKGVEYDSARADDLLDKFNLLNRKNDLLKSYSSGMLQRVKLIFALLHNPNLLILDEPTSNLDEKGKAIFYGIIKEESRNSLVIIASNENDDLALCNERINIEEYKQ